MAAARAAPCPPSAARMRLHTQLAAAAASACRGRHECAGCRSR
jgi:hypothetical protein